MIKMMYDISMNISNNVQVYKNKENKKPHFTQVANFTEQGVYETEMTMNLHTGTHIDFPLHILDKGDTSSSLDLLRLFGEAIVIDLSNSQDDISSKDFIEQDIRENDFVLLKTKNSFSEEFLFNFAYLSADGANYLIQKNIQGVGTDGLGIERSQEGHPTHKILLSNQKLIIEGLRLKDIQPGRYDFICLPIKIDSVEALPARAILFNQK